MKWRRFLLPAVIGVALYVAAFGGEYTVLDLRRVRGELAQTEAELVALRRQTDSLRARADSLEHDLGTLERLARERYGLIRDGETLYRVVPADSADASGRTPDGG